MFTSCSSINFNAAKYPVLASLAKDYLAICGASSAVERKFSGAADVCCRDRGALKPPTIERLVGSCMWSEDGVNIAGEDLEECQKSMAECMDLDMENRKRKGQ